MNEIGMAQRQRQRDQDVEQHRQFELVAEAIADLGGADRPVRLSERDILDPGLAADQRISAGADHPEQQRESEPDQDEDRQQNHLNRHGNSPDCAPAPRYSGRAPG